MVSELSPNDEQILKALGILMGFRRIHLSAINAHNKTIISRCFKRVEDAVEWVRDQNRKRFNIYWGVNPVVECIKGEDRKDYRDQFALKKANKEEVFRVDYFHLDLDCPEDEDPELWRKAERNRIMNWSRKIPEPSVAVESGGGFNLFWRLETPITVGTNDPKIFDRYNHALADHLGGDHVSADISHLLRVPGTINWPDEKKRKRGRVPVMARLLYDNENIYSQKDFDSFLLGAYG